MFYFIKNDRYYITIGYSGFMIDEFISKIKEYKIDVKDDDF